MQERNELLRYSKRLNSGVTCAVVLNAELEKWKKETQSRGYRRGIMKIYINRIP